MKNYIDPFELGSVPIFNDDIINLQNQGLELTKAVYKNNYGNSREGAVVIGCAVTDPGGGDLTTATGTVFLDGDFFLLDAVTTTSPYYIIPGTSTFETRQFKDGGTKNVIEVKKATTSASIPVTGQYITINRVIDDHNRWIGFSEAGGTYNAGWSDNASFPLQFRKTNGFVEWRGCIGSNAPGTGVIFDTELGFEDIHPGEEVGGGANLSPYALCVSSVDLSILPTQITSSGSGIDLTLNGTLLVNDLIHLNMRYSLDQF